MLKNKTAIATLTASLAFFISGCENSPTQDITDIHAQDLLLNTKTPSSLINKYHPMINKDGNHIGVLFVSDIHEDKEKDSMCVTYNSFTSYVNKSSYKGIESTNRKTCLTTAALKHSL